MSIRVGDIATASDSNGYFKIVIPEDMQSEVYDLVIEKAGYKTQKIKVFPKENKMDVELQKLY